MPLYKKAAKLEKPTSLQNYLLTKNYIVLTTEVPVGDIVEHGLDWVLDTFVLFNNALGDTFLYFEDRLNLQDDKHAALEDELLHLISQLNKMDFFTIEDYYDLKFIHDLEIRDYVGSVVNPMKGDISTLQAYQTWLRGEVDKLNSEASKAWINIDVDISLLEYKISGIEDEFTESGIRRWNLFQWTWLFFRDPVQFSYDLFDEVIIRFF